jgi:hypothetical protein
MTNMNGPSGRGFYIALTAPKPGVVWVSTHGLMRDVALGFSNGFALLPTAYDQALAQAKKWARESGFYIHDHVRRRANGDPRIYKS